MRFKLRIVAALLAAALASLLTVRAYADVLISVDKNLQQMTVSVDGQLRWVWPVSTGRPGYDTSNGEYTAFRLDANHVSHEWDNAPMPHSIFFNGGEAIHGSLETRRLGRPVSHGCVRLLPANAAKLFAVVKAEGLPHTHVVIEGKIPTAAEIAARERRPDTTASVRDSRRAAAFPMPSARPDRAYIERHYRRAQMRNSRGEQASLATAAHADLARPVPSTRRLETERRGQARRARILAERHRLAEQRAYSRQRSYAGARVYYDPRVEVTETTYVNGVLVRRHYYRRARPSDFAGWR